MIKKYVYLFEEGNQEMRTTLGGKGANLAEMTRNGFPVPHGFTISTDACKIYYDYDRQLTSDIYKQMEEALQQVEQRTGKKLGDRANPLLVSVRSGSVHSMPGMMDTILNLGLNDETVVGLAQLTHNERFAYDCYRRFLQMFGDVVLGISHNLYEHVLNDIKGKAGVSFDTELGPNDWLKVIEAYKNITLKETGKPFPQNPSAQLDLAIRAVFDSWNNQRAQVYRKAYQIPDHLGTAVNVQLMVFGNMGNDSGTGVAFTRNPSTGEKTLYGEYLINAQGEDVVAGIRTPEPIHSLQRQMPEVYDQFLAISQRLENHYLDMQDIEFTIEKGKLYILQTRNGKRTVQSAVKIAVDMVNEGLLTREEALLRVDPNSLEKLLHRGLDPHAAIEVIAKGLPASPGAASGKVVFDATVAQRLAHQGEKVILVRPETTPEDIHGIIASTGILTSRGGMTSHAAVVARGMGKSCICGCEELQIDLQAKQFQAAGYTVKEGDKITIDGGTGRVILGEAGLVDPEFTDEFHTLLEWADEVRKIEVRANADNPADAKIAKDFGADGIGLCRTEHMFMDSDRLPIVQEMILASSMDERLNALDRLLPIQQKDFYGILKEMKSLPVTIRLLDPPLHEFLPNLEDLLVKVTLLKERKANPAQILHYEELLRKVRSLHEFNPMLGNRGCRLGIIFPEIYSMQVEAILRAAIELKKEGIHCHPEIMIPLVGDVKELSIMKKLVNETARSVMDEKGVEITYMIGTMIEVPRAALTADEIAAEADFFSFGTNDLTQTTFGYSRDDAEGKFLGHYVDNQILDHNPFEVLDQKGVGKLVKLGAELGRKTKPNLELGICGEHGGEKSSIQYCYEIGLDYVSCSPYRIAIARFAAAQAAIQTKEKRGKIYI
jgi:pyruvate, orthophosphate dikinase